jgi:UvrD-like helicase C-terminal domain/UvrD/REP helicase N-terminal domain
VLVDEVQDLVSVRADLVLEILRRTSGFTALGDPAQAIYGYQVEGHPTATTSEQFLAGLIDEHPDLSVVILEDDFRSRHSRGEPVAEIGAILRDPRTDDTKALPRLIEALGDLDHVDSFDDLAFALSGVHEKTAVLCRTNAECLRVSEILFEAGVTHHLQQEAAEQVLPPWLAELFRGTVRTTWGEPRLRGLIEERRAAGVALPDTTAVVDYMTDAVRDDTVKLDVLRERIRWSQAPEPPASAAPTPVVVSTIHRAKGLEFDRVFFAAPRDGVPTDSAEELRVLYVALSRCRDDVWTFKAPNTKLWWKPEGPADRWIKSPFRERWKTLGWEVRPADVDAMRPPGAAIAEAPVDELQGLLAGTDLVGSPVDLKLAHVRESEEPIAFYSLMVDGQVIGVTGESFGESLRRRLRRSRGVSYPPAMSRVFLVGVETVIGPTSEGEANGLGASGLWLRPRIAGLAHIEWYAE